MYYYVCKEVNFQIFLKSKNYLIKIFSKKLFIIKKNPKKKFLNREVDTKINICLNIILGIILLN